MFRDICGGGKGSSGSSYDPQIGQAAKKSADIADRAQQFSENYYNTVITPLIKQQNDASIESQQKLGRLYDVNWEQTKLAVDRYKQYGIPAEERYYKMVDEYSQDQEYEKQAGLAKGDLNTALANQQMQVARQQRALGIDPTSGAAISARGDQAIMGAAMQAAAMSRARQGAKALGMQLISDAANFGRGGQSGILQFGAGAQGNATGAFGIANQALGTGMQAGNSVLQGYDIAAKSYNNIMSNYAQMGAAEIGANASQSDPLGTLLGGTLGMFAGSIKSSDARLKENLVPVGTTKDGLTIFIYNLIGETKRQWGVLAQAALAVRPDAVLTLPSGHYAVDYGKLNNG